MFFSPVSAVRAVWLDIWLLTVWYPLPDQKRPHRHLCLLRSTPDARSMHLGWTLDDDASSDGVSIFSDVSKVSTNTAFTDENQGDITAENNQPGIITVTTEVRVEPVTESTDTIAQAWVWPTDAYLSVTAQEDCRCVLALPT